MSVGLIRAWAVLMLMGDEMPRKAWSQGKESQPATRRLTVWGRRKGMGALMIWWASLGWVFVRKAGRRRKSRRRSRRRGRESGSEKGDEE